MVIIAQLQHLRVCRRHGLEPTGQRVVALKFTRPPCAQELPLFPMKNYPRQLNKSGKPPEFPKRSMFGIIPRSNKRLKL